MFKPRERYNAKARGSVAGGKKKGKRPHSAVESGAPETDPNTAMMVPRTKAEKDAERIERLRHEVRWSFSLREHFRMNKCQCSEVGCTAGCEINQQEKEET